jgi:hypothetical protein
MKFLKQTARVLCALGVLAAGVSFASAANLILNPGFESPTVPAGGSTVFSGGPLGTHWKVFGYSVSLTNKTALMFGRTMSARSGQQWLNLAGPKVSGILYASGVKQTIATTIGQTYTFSMWVGALHLPGDTQSVFSKAEVYANGKLVTIGFNLDGPSTVHQNWRKVTGTFVANATSTEIAILNGGTAANVNNLCAIDDIAVN